MIPGMAAGQMRNSAGSVDPYWASVVALMHFDGSDGSTTITDSSSYARALTAAGNAQIDTAQSVFGGASLVMDGTGDRVTSASEASLIIGAQDFTLEGWLRTTVKERALLDLRTLGSTGFYFGVAATTGRLQVFCNAGPSVNLFGGTDVCDGNWHSFYFARVSGVMYFGVDGSGDGSGALTNNANAVSAMTIGAANNNTVNFNGHLDEMRLTVGVGRYTGAWTPAGPFPNG